MNLRQLILLLVGVTFIFFLTFFFVIGYLKPKPAGLSVESNPKSNIFINGRFVGKTPYEASVKSQEIVVKLVPESSNLVSYETKVSLLSGIKTIVKRSLAESEDASSGEVISFEKEIGSESSLAIVSIPDNVLVTVDSLPKGFTPLRLSNFSPGAHQITLQTKGFLSNNFLVKTVAGYKLTAFVKLAVDSSFAPEVKRLEVPVATGSSEPKPN